MPAPQFRLFLDSVVWAFKHTLRDIGDMGLTICTEMLTNFSKSEAAIANAFFKSYFISILQDVFFVLTSTSHKSGFRLQSMILSQLFGYVDSGLITVPLFDPSTVPNPNMTNQDFLRDYVTTTLHQAFPHLQLAQVRQFVLGLFELHKDYNAFRQHLRDFLITLKEFQSDDATDLFISDREAEAERNKQQQFEAALRIPGMVKPSERPDDGMMD
jgi:exportin-1